jgi:tetratricopeptide (TPR) repeat protein
MNAHRAANKETYDLAAQAFTASLQKNPYYRDALYNLSTAYYQLRDTARILDAARRLVAVDPLNRNSNLLLAQAYQVNGKGDSALHYLQMADSLLPIEVTVSELELGEQRAAVGGLITNHHNRPSAPTTLVFEFLNTRGEVVPVTTGGGEPKGAVNVDVPQLAGQGNHPFRVEVQGSGISAYRYRKR